MGDPAKRRATYEGLLDRGKRGQSGWSSWTSPSFTCTETSPFRTSPAGGARGCPSFPTRRPSTGSPLGEASSDANRPSRFLPRARHALAARPGAQAVAPPPASADDGPPVDARRARHLRAASGHGSGQGARRSAKPSKSQDIFCTEGGTRTLTPFRTADFESAASAIPPLRHLGSCLQLLLLALRTLVGRRRLAIAKSGSAL